MELRDSSVAGSKKRNYEPRCRYVDRTGINTISIVRVHHENKALSVLIVMSP